MTQPDHRAPRRRSDTTHSTSTRPGGRRSGDRRPWPTAPFTTRLSPGKPADSTTRRRSRDSTSTPTPATVWTAGTHPIDLDATWPTALVEKVVVSFSAPAARVVLVDWPTSTADPASATELVDAARAVERLDRTARVARVPVESPPSNSASTPARANTGPLPTTIPTAPVAPRTATRHRGTTHPGTADLVVTSWRPSLPCGIGAADLVALFAARLLRLGGILVVLTRCDWTSGELLDLTGAAVTAGQNADLLYLQHIVAVHTPVHDGRFELPGAHPGHPHSADSKDPRTRARRIASEHRRAPEPHRRIHSDVLVFAQPHDHQPPPSPHQDSRLRSGDLR